MPGYANRTIRIAFPDLTEAGDPEVFVTIRNPKIVPTQDLIPRDVSDDEFKRNPRAYFMATYALIASLITAWHVYDATSDDPDPKPLDLPATEETVATLPREITEAIVAKINDARNPGAGA
jgi:hypothetical protein